MAQVGRSIRIVLGFSFIVSLPCSCSKHHEDNTKNGNQATVTLIHALPSVLHESSGLCYTDGNLWSFGDSGNPPSLFKIDTATGNVLQTVTIQNFSNEDWEDIAADDEYIYAGDFGNNNGNRKDLKILRVRKSDIRSTSSQVNVNAAAIYFSFADQRDFTANNHSDFNCEALVSIGDDLYMFTKDESDFQTRCYGLSKTPGTYAVAPISSFNAEGEITSAAYNPTTKELALVGYQSGKVYPFIWFFKNYEGDHFFEGDKTKVWLRNDNAPWQTEGIDYITANRMFMSCESNGDTPASLYALALHLAY